MDALERLKDWIASGKTEIEPSLLAYVLLYSTQQDKGLKHILEHLASFWSQEQVDSKQKCIELLAQIVTPSQSSLDSNTINAIIQFVGDRLGDNVLIPRCIDIFSVLMNTSIISSTDTIQLCNAIFDKIKVKKLSQQSRYKVLVILGKSIDKYPSEIQRSKMSFIDGFINCIDGEKDPRNLMIAFELVRAIIDRFDISRHIEDLFEVVFCYFPISFAAPANDLLGITTKDLKDSLRRCFAATPYFAYYATPLLIEKLLTTKGSAKKDVMETISLCAPAYGAHAILPHSQDLFDALVKEVYQGVDAAMVDIALQTIHNVVATLGTGISIANIRDPVEKAIDFLLQKCVQELKEPELKNARSAAYILRAAASASDPACTSVAHTAVPIICQQYKPTDPSIRQKAIIDILTELLIASKTLYGSVEDVGYDRDFQTPLLMYKQQILQVFILSLAEPDASDTTLKQASLKGFHEMVLMKHFLKQEEINVAAGHLTQQLILSNKEIRNLALSTLGVVSKLYPLVIGQHTLPVLLNELAYSEQPMISEKYRDALDAIEVLGTSPAVFKIVISALLQKLDFACTSIGQRHVSYVHEIAATLLHIYHTAIKDTEVMLIGQKTILPTLLFHCVQSASGQGQWYLDDVLIDIFAMIAAITTRLSSSSEQQQSIQNVFQVFVYGDLSLFDQDSMSKDTPLSIFSSIEKDAVDITLLFAAMIGNCRKDVQLPVPSVPTFLQQLIETATQTPSKTRKQALVKIAASIINKWIDDALVACIQKITLEKGFLLDILVWIMKALIVRGHKYGFELLDDVIKACGSLELGKEAADSFIILLQQDELILNKASHAVVSVLYKQRVFNHCYRKLMQGAEQMDIRNPELQIHYLSALMNVLKNIPSQAAINELPKLMLPITVALSIQDVSLVKSTLDVAHDIVPNAQDLVVQHLGSFIHALLRNTQFPCVSIRILALDCLSLIAKNGRPEVLSPFKPSVVKELSVALDDKKRIVRKNAVDCRERWYAIGK